MDQARYRSRLMDARRDIEETESELINAEQQLVHLKHRVEELRGDVGELKRIEAWLARKAGEPRAAQPGAPSVQTVASVVREHDPSPDAEVDDSPVRHA